MSGERLGFAALLATMVVVGALAWWLSLRPGLEVDASRLSDIPLQFDIWRGVDIPLEDTVEAVLLADASVQRAYLHPSGDVVFLYVGYYGTDRGGRPEHVPRGCYAGAGWTIRESRRLSLGGEPALRVNEYLVERDGEERLVQFWYRSHRRGGMVGGLDQNLDRLLGRLGDGRADGALIRISTPMRDGDVVAARTRLASLASRLDAAIAERWPVERPAR